MIGSGRKQLVVFTNQLAAMLRSNLPLVPVLNSLAEESLGGTMKTALSDVVRRVSSGEDFAQALDRHPGIFGPEFVSIARSGMESGLLAEAMSRAASYLDRIDTIQTKLQSALIYPGFLFAGFIAIFHVLVFFVLPRFEEIFAQFSKSLPVPTRLLIAVGEFYSTKWYVILLAVFLVGIALVHALSQKSVRKWWDKVKLSIPIIGRIWHLSALARFAHTMSLQVDSSVSLVDALRTAAPATRNLYYSDLVLKAAFNIENGEGVAIALSKNRLFGGAAQQMVMAGEQTGEIDEMFAGVAGYYDNLWMRRMDSVAGIVNPIMTVLVGGAIAGMIVAAFLPVFNISGLTLG